jgi:Antitoxin Phd_YefM, type II toxin-antitoxin system
MKIENIREVKTRFSRYVKDLAKTGSVVITKNGRLRRAGAGDRRYRPRSPGAFAEQTLLETH